jgi:WD40 repeat protein
MFDARIRFLLLLLTLGAVGCRREQPAPDAESAQEDADHAPAAQGDAAAWDRLPPGAVARLGHRERGIVPLAFSKDGSRFATGHTDSHDRRPVAHIWEAATGKEVAVLKGHAGRILSGAFSPDGASFASGGMDNTLIFWDLKSGKPIAKESLNGHGYQVAYLPGGDRLISASNEIILWNVRPKPTVAATFSMPPEFVFHIALAPDGKRLVAGDEFIVRLWDVPDAKLIKTLYDRPDAWLRFVYAPDCKTIVEYDDKAGQIRRRAAASGDPMPDAPVQVPRGYGRDAQFSPDARYLGLLMEPQLGHHDVVIYAVATGKQMCRIPGRPQQGLSFRFSPDSNTVVVGESGGSLRLYDVADGKLLRSYLEAPQPIMGVNYSADGQTLRSLTTENGRLTSHDWDVARAAETRQTPVGAPVESKSVRMSADGKLFALVDGKGQFQVWSVPANKLLWESDKPLMLPERERLHRGGKSGGFKGPPPRGDALLAFSADGHRIAGLTSGHDVGAGWVTAGRVAIWEAATGKQLDVVNLPLPADVRHVRVHNPTSVRCLALGPSSKQWYIALGGPGHVVLMDPASGKVMGKLDVPERPHDDPEARVADSAVTQMEFSPDGKQLAVVERIATPRFEGADYHLEIRMWDLSDPPRQRLISRPAATAPVFSNDGSSIAFGLAFAKRHPPMKGDYWDAGVAVWDTRQGKLAVSKLETQHPFDAPVEHLAFAPNGRQLATSGPDRTILIWDVEALFRRPR